MKSLKESLFDQEDIDPKEIEKAMIMKWLKDNYKRDNALAISLDEKKVIPFFDVIVVNTPIDRLLPEGWSFADCPYDFYCLDCKNLKSLEGAPKKVNGGFYVTNSAIESLEYGPEYVKCDYTCNSCKNLKSLKGAPKRVFRFFCDNCSNLKSLKGAPDICSRFDCSKCGIKNLEGMPGRIDDRFICEECPDLVSLKGVTKIEGSICLKDCISLHSLDYLPDKVSYLDIRGCPIKDYSILDKIKIYDNVLK